MNRIGKKWVAANAALATMLFMAREALAAADTTDTTLSTIATKLGTEIGSLKTPAMVIAGVTGLVLTIIGIIEFKNLGDPHMRQQASVGKAVMNLIVGVALLTLTWWIGTTVSTLGGTADSYTIELK